MFIPHYFTIYNIYGRELRIEERLHVLRFKLIVKTQSSSSIKGTVNVFQRDPSVVGWNVRLTTASFKRLSDHGRRKYPYIFSRRVLEFTSTVDSI